MVAYTHTCTYELELCDIYSHKTSHQKSVCLYAAEVQFIGTASANVQRKSFGCAEIFWQSRINNVCANLYFMRWLVGGSRVDLTVARVSFHRYLWYSLYNCTHRIDSISIMFISQRFAMICSAPYPSKAFKIRIALRCRRGRRRWQPDSTKGRRQRHTHTRAECALFVLVRVNVCVSVHL